MTEPKIDDTARCAVYFDGSCPLCRREIALYQKSEGADGVQFVDVSAGQGLPTGLDAATAMRRFHIRDAKGQLQSGARAFIALWLTLPRWRWLGRMASVPPLPSVLEGLYRLSLIIRPAMQRLARRSGLS